MAFVHGMHAMNVCIAAIATLLRQHVWNVKHFVALSSKLQHIYNTAHYKRLACEHTAALDRVRRRNSTLKMVCSIFFKSWTPVPSAGRVPQQVPHRQPFFEQTMHFHVSMKALELASATYATTAASTIAGREARCSCQSRQATVAYVHNCQLQQKGQSWPTAHLAANKRTWRCIVDTSSFAGVVKHQQLFG